MQNLRKSGNNPKLSYNELRVLQINTSLLEQKRLEKMVLSFGVPQNQIKATPFLSEACHLHSQYEYHIVILDESCLQCEQAPIQQSIANIEDTVKAAFLITYTSSDLALELMALPQDKKEAVVYLQKPFCPKELYLRFNMILTRSINLKVTEDDKTLTSANRAFVKPVVLSP